MPPQAASPAPSPRRIGGGIDTSRSSRYAAFLRGDLRPAAAERASSESVAGSARWRQRLDDLTRRYGPVAFAVRLDAARPYADDVRHSLQARGRPTAGAAGGPASRARALSGGDPHRNKNCRAAEAGGPQSGPARPAPRRASASPNGRSVTDRWSWNPWKTRPSRTRPLARPRSDSDNNMAD